MTVTFGWLHRLFCGQERQADRTTELINEAEHTRHELIRLTERLTGHVAALQAFARAYAGPQEGPRDG